MKAVDLRAENTLQLSLPIQNQYITKSLEEKIY